MYKVRYKLLVAHRVCDRLADSAICFTSKIDMIRANIWSLLRAIGSTSTFLYIILDGCPDFYAEFYDSFLSSNLGKNSSYKIIHTNNLGNHATFGKQLELLKSNKNLAEYLYFSEDDYFYVKDSLKVMLQFMDKNKDVDFLSPLDHPDRYTHFIPEPNKAEIRSSEGHHWRSVSSTCCTFMTRSNIIEKCYMQLKSYADGCGDGPLWLGITKNKICSPKYTFLQVLKYAFGKRKIIEGPNTNWGDFIVLETWIWHKWNLITFKKWRLWAPIPTLAIHMCKPSISPCSDALLQQIDDFKRNEYKFTDC